MEGNVLGVNLEIVDLDMVDLVCGTVAACTLFIKLAEETGT
jgi:hypothetical protein